MCRTKLNKMETDGRDKAVSLEIFFKLDLKWDKVVITWTGIRKPVQGRPLLGPAKISQETPNLSTDVDSSTENQRALSDFFSFRWTLLN